MNNQSTCPWCGSRKVRVFSWDHETHYGECLNPDCRASGPLRSDIAAARTAWNDGPKKVEGR